MTLTKSDYNKELPLKFVKFQNVTKLTIFVANNQQNSDCTSLIGVQLLGQTMQATQSLDQLKKVEHDH